MWQSRGRGGAYFTMCGIAGKGEEPILPCVAEQGKRRSLFYHVWQSRERGGAYFTMCGRAGKGEEPILPCVAEHGYL